MRVLHIMSGFGGGISSFILNKAKYFRNQGDVIFDVITYDEVSTEFLDNIRATGGNVYRIVNPKVEGVKAYYKSVNDIMKKLPKDTFVHCHIIGYRAIPFYLIAQKNGLKKFGVHAHTTGLPEEINSLKNKAVRLINTKVSSAKLSCGKEASNYLFGNKYVQNKEIMHIPNSLNPEEFIKDLKVNKETVLGKEYRNKYVIGHIGRFHPVKNHHFMIEIIELLIENKIDFVWIFVGDGNELESIKSIVNKKELNSHVKFLGRRNDIPQILQVLDLFVLPSFYEGFPTVAVEAQASSTYSILSDTVTEEVDLQLGLIDFLPIEAPVIWVEHIKNHLNRINIDPRLRLESLKNKKLTNQESAELYKDFLEGKITHYEIK